ncbi:NADH-ubiquinone oxidoreductase-F iron-sulfur binding region domain-containing protein [Streptomyces sp. NPDC101209]|uniref:NADH-ubiquinone oxidoreductase-F iron-sulfur binding region domain-containing protein n=1 Tax=Streptomyces sp. NPDC101209 TaxID=3366129 RepID=UPI0037F3C1A6
METPAHLALVARYGAQWFRTAGTDAQPGSALCTVHVPGHRPRVVEAPFGMPLHRLLPVDGMSAVLLGGYHGTWVPPDVSTMGAGVLAALPAERCGLVERAQALRWMALRSAGQCGPCLNGLPRIAAAFRTLAAPGRHGTARTDVARWAGLVEGRGACHHPHGPPGAQRADDIHGRTRRPRTGLAHRDRPHIRPDEWGYPLVAGTPLPAHTVKRARRAAADCPVLALKVTVEEPKPHPRS